MKKKTVVALFAVLAGFCVVNSIKPEDAATNTASADFMHTFTAQEVVDNATQKLAEDVMKAEQKMEQDYQALKKAEADKLTVTAPAEADKKKDAVGENELEVLEACVLITPEGEEKKLNEHENQRVDLPEVTATSDVTPRPMSAVSPLEANASSTARFGGGKFY